jgi:hypothetical protein
MVRLRACWTTHAPTGLAGDPSHVDPPGVDLDEEEHLEAPKQHRVDGEEVTGQFAVDPAISPDQVLSRQPQDYLDGAGGHARSTRTTGIGPSAPNQVPMPAKQGLGLDEEPPEAPAAKEAAQPGEQRARSLCRSAGRST